MLRRRTVLGLGLALAAVRPVRAGGIDRAALEAQAEAIETRAGGRLGVALRVTEGGARWSRRGGEPFPMCSTFKLPLAAAVLARVDRGEESLDRRVPIAAADVVEGSPFARTRVGGDAAVGDLCEAAMTLSDNACANLLLASIGGPEGLTRFARAIGDRATRLDRTEPALNEALPGDPRDTTTPDAIAGAIETLVFGEALAPSSHGRLTRWLVDNRTGGARLRAGLPADWSVGDKTGSGARGTTNDVGVLWPPHGPAIVIACYLTGSRLDADARDAIHVDVARAAVAALR